MNLFNTGTSAEALDKAKQIAKSLLGKNSNIVFVDGRIGNKCQSLSGSGFLNFAWCQISQRFFCEYRGKFKFINQSYSTRFILIQNSHIDNCIRSNEKLSRSF